MLVREVQHQDAEIEQLKQQMARLQSITQAMQTSLAEMQGKAMALACGEATHFYITSPLSNAGVQSDRSVRTLIGILGDFVSSPRKA